MTKQIFGDIILTCSGYFLCCSRPSSTSARGSKDTNIGHDCIRDSVTGSAYIRSVYGMGTYIGSVCVNSVNAVKRSRMHS